MTREKYDTKQETKQQPSRQETTQPASSESLATSTTSSISASSSVSSAVERIPARFAIGRSDFRTMREVGNLIVDKSLLIKEIIDDDQASKKLCIRSRRSGKTLNLRMIELFFDSSTKEESSRLFQSLKIWSVDGGRYQAHQGSRPVIYLTFKDIHEDTFSEALDHFKDEIGSLYKRLHEKYGFDRTEEVNQIIKKTCSIEQLKRSLRNLSEILGKHCGTEVVILIDECDTPLQAAYKDMLLHQVGTEKKAEQKEESSHAEIMNFMRDLLSSTFKDNPHVYRAVLMGILPILDESMLADSNITVYGVLDQRLSPYFGFSRDEVREKLVHVFGDEFFLDEVESSYGGYQVGDEALFNPWSIVNFIEDNRGQRDKFKFIFRPHWINTSGNDFIKELIERAGPDVIKKVKELIESQAVVELINKNMALNEVAKAAYVVWSFLLFTGYVTYVDHVCFTTLAEGFKRAHDHQRLWTARALDEAVVIAEELINQGFIDSHVFLVLCRGIQSRNIAESSLAVRQLGKPMVFNWFKEAFQTNELLAISNALSEEPSRRQKIMAALSTAVSESKTYETRKVSGAPEVSTNTYILKIPNKELLGFFKELLPTLRVNKSEAKVVAPVGFFAGGVPDDVSAGGLRKAEDSRKHKLFNGTIKEKITVAQELMMVNHVDALTFDTLIRGLFSERIVERRFVDREFAAEQLKNPIVLAWLRQSKKARDSLLNASNKIAIYRDYFRDDYSADTRRIELLGVLGSAGNVNAIDLLIKEAENPDHRRNDEAIAALGECVGISPQQDKRVVGFLNYIFYKEDQRPIYKASVLKALMKIVSQKKPMPAAITILVDALEKDPESWLRIRAAEALARSSLINDQITNALVKVASEDAESDVRSAAQRALDRFGQRADAKPSQQQTTAASSVSTGPSIHGPQQSALEGTQSLQPGRGM